MKKIVVILFAFGLLFPSFSYAQVSQEQTLAELKAQLIEVIKEKIINLQGQVKILEQEESLFDLLNEEGKAFLTKAIEVRADLPEGNDYKYMVWRKDRLQQIKRMIDKDGYLHLNPTHFDMSDPFTGNNVIYRYVKDCKTKVTLQRQIINLSEGYGNISGGDRYKEQCINDGSMDTYYLESYTRLEDK